MIWGLRVEGGLLKVWSLLGCGYWSHSLISIKRVIWGIIQMMMVMMIGVQGGCAQICRHDT